MGIHVSTPSGFDVIRCKAVYASFVAYSFVFVIVYIYTRRCQAGFQSNFSISSLLQSLLSSFHYIFTMPSTREEEIYYGMLATARAWNTVQARYYGAAIGGLVALFIIAHWISKLCSNSTATRTVLRPISRFLKGFALGSWLILPGRLILAATYFAINGILWFTNGYWNLPDLGCAKRCGW